MYRLNSAILAQKRTRANIIAQYLDETQRPLRVVCFTCGNAAKALRGCGLNIVEVGPYGALQTDRWWTPTEIAVAWPDHFDATSGHLPVWMMRDIGQALATRLVGAGVDLREHNQVAVPSGSGETLVCLATAYLNVSLVAEYDNALPETTYNQDAPLNRLVQALATEVRIIGPHGEAVTS
jgi:hypothetical protein